MEDIDGGWTKPRWLMGKIGTMLATLAGAWHYGISVRASRLDDVNILWPGDTINCRCFAPQFVLILSVIDVLFLIEA